MNKRTFILCASFGTLVLSAAQMPVSMAPGSGPVPQAPWRASAEQTSQTSSSPSPSVEQFSAAFAPSEAPSSPEAPAPPLEVDEATVWLARAIYSETKLPHEQELVAWVVRNRVDTGYRGQTTYREVVLDPYQFSAFNPGSPKRPSLLRLRPDTPFPGWQQALWVAYYVRHADPMYRPFSIDTRHFYSERSMDGRRAPYWAESDRFVAPDAPRYVVDEERFRFFKLIS